MTSATVTLFFALLAVASFAFVGAATVLLVGSRRSQAIEAVRARLAADLRRQALGFAAFVAAIATLGSLYLSEVAGFPPCTWCWVQRGFMYPLAVVLAVTAWTGRPAVRMPARAWALAGAAASMWHIALERVPSLEGAGLCDPTNPCSLRWVEHLGFVTIPVMALAAFLLVATLLSIRPAAPQSADP